MNFSILFVCIASGIIFALFIWACDGDTPERRRQLNRADRKWGDE